MLCLRICVSHHQMLAVWLDSSHSPGIFLLWFKPLLLLLVFLLSSFSADILSSITSFSTGLAIWCSISLTNSLHLGRIGFKFSSFGNSFGWFWRTGEMGSVDSSLEDSLLIRSCVAIPSLVESNDLFFDKKMLVKNHREPKLSMTREPSMGNNKPNKTIIKGG